MKKTILLILVQLLWLPALSQDANRYVDAYKQYLDAGCPLQDDNIQHFVYFSRDRELIHDHPMLEMPRIAGAQIMYSWRQLERQKGNYDFSIIREDYEYLKSRGKKLFVQFQDLTFNVKYKALPNYLLTQEYDGGAVSSPTDTGEEGGWKAKRWNPKVQERFALLMQALGAAFDGKIEGINLQETAIGIPKDNDPSYTTDRYAECIKENMLALKKGFPTSTTMQYANFVPGEWLPWEDRGYLRSIYAYGEEIGVGLGAPDLMVTRKGQLNHAMTMMHESEYTVPLGIAVQDGNYVGATGADTDYYEQVEIGQRARKNIVPMLHAFAKDFLRVNYIFWVNQEPYFSEDVAKCLTGSQ